MKTFNFRIVVPAVTVALYVASAFANVAIAQSSPAVSLVDVAAQIDAGQWRAAERNLQAMLKADPSRLEYYVNLAALYARQGKLNQAKVSLQQGLQADQHAAMLWAGLQRINGALAANAYQRALDKNEPDLALKAVQLPVVRTLASETRSEIAIPESFAKPEMPSPEAHNAEVAALTAELAAQKRHYEQKLDQLQRQMSEQEAVIAEMRSKQSVPVLGQHQESPVSIPVMRQQTEASPVDPTSTLDTISIESGLSLDQAAIQHVQRWASAWAARDKAAYIAFYDTDYAPGEYVNRTRWLQQTDLYFANAKPIQLDLSDFEVIDQGGSVAVTFSQHYQSASFDETSRKRLVFVLSNSDWRTAKIIKEQTVSG
ncbi:hypothetical protein GCM10008090_19710 [Arenicella chitinivorans]|uniref:Cds6 C-terminal domain-containing protein n=1 Tax=Arenicella chitinivorans TaxID=1329800 RepID=A0A918RTB7_9GAMM|nr:tetratricopeptide repeat protein [Arenicella chitinivorans]GHA10203.1 hypothetical protein GCM10008090_19710 [Arenicella chitinivorans]